MDFHELWKELIVGVVVGLVLMYQQRKINKFDEITDMVHRLDREAVKWPDHEKEMKKLEERHDRSIERVLDKLDSIQGEMQASLINLYKLLLENKKD